MERLTLVLPDPAWERQAEDYRQAYLDSGECHINGSSAMERYPVYSGYGVRPDERKKGYASQMLTLALDFCRKIGLERVLLDCRADNAASERTIRKCGGISAGEAQVPGDDGQPERIRRFWIAV